MQKLVHSGTEFRTTSKFDQPWYTCLKGIVVGEVTCHILHKTLLVLIVKVFFCTGRPAKAYFKSFQEESMLSKTDKFLQYLYNAAEYSTNFTNKTLWNSQREHVQYVSFALFTFTKLTSFFTLLVIFGQKFVLG